MVFIDLTLRTALAPLHGKRHSQWDMPTILGLFLWGQLLMKACHSWEKVLNLPWTYPGSGCVEKELHLWYQIPQPIRVAQASNLGNYPGTCQTSSSCRSMEIHFANPQISFMTDCTCPSRKRDQNRATDSDLASTPQDGYHGFPLAFQIIYEPSTHNVSHSGPIH